MEKEKRLYWQDIVILAEPEWFDDDELLFDPTEINIIPDRSYCVKCRYSVKRENYKQHCQTKNHFKCQLKRNVRE